MGVAAQCGRCGRRTLAEPSACIGCFACFGCLRGAPSLGLRLLGDLRTVFGDRDAMWTVEILLSLVDLEESPWGDLKGKPLDARRLAHLLRPYGVVSKQVRLGEKSQKGYTKDNLWDS